MKSARWCGLCPCSSYVSWTSQSLSPPFPFLALASTLSLPLALVWPGQNNITYLNNIIVTTSQQKHNNIT